MHAVVGMHKDEITVAIETATATELREIDDALASLGYAQTGLLRQRIAARLAPKETEPWR